MKKTLAAAAAFLFLTCFITGCLREGAPTPTESGTAAESESATVSETVAGTTTLTVTTTTATTTEPASTAAEKSTSTTTAKAASTTAKPTSATETVTESAAKKPLSTTTTAATTTMKPTSTTATKPDSTEKTTTTTTTATTTTTTTTTSTTIKPVPTKPQTTRRSLIDRLRDLRAQNETPQPDPAFFDDAVFVGDSVTQGLRNYVTGQRNKGKACLGSAQFLCFGSMSYTNALGSVDSQSMHPTYKGKKVRVEDGVQLCGAKKVFIMLGMNDFAGYGEKTWKKNVCALLDKIVEKNPDAAIYVESVTPILSGMEHGRFTNANIRTFNAYLQQVCEDSGYTYVDIYHVLADENGYLKKSYCGDPDVMGIHMSGAGCAAWVQYLQSAFCGA